MDNFTMSMDAMCQHAQLYKLVAAGIDDDDDWDEEFDEDDNGGKYDNEFAFDKDQLYIPMMFMPGQASPCQPPGDLTCSISHFIQMQWGKLPSKQPIQPFSINQCNFVKCLVPTLVIKQF